MFQSVVLRNGSMLGADRGREGTSLVTARQVLTISWSWISQTTCQPSKVLAQSLLRDPSSAVSLRSPRFAILNRFTSCGGGEIGRRTSLRCWRPKGIGVQVPSSAPKIFSSGLPARITRHRKRRVRKQLTKCRFSSGSSSSCT